MTDKIPPKWIMKRFGDSVYTLSIPYKYTSIEYRLIGEYKIIDQGKEPHVGYSNNVDHLINDTPVVLFGDHTKVVKYIDFPFCIGSDGTKLFKSSVMTELFLFYTLIRAAHKLPNLAYSRHFTELKNIMILIPPLFEQKKIAAILSTWDEAITKQKSLVDQTRKRNEGLTHQLLSGEKRLVGFKKEVKKITLNKCAENINLRNRNGLKTASLFGVTKKYGLIPMREHVKGEIFSNCKVVKTNWFAYNPMRINIGSIALWSGNEDIMVSGDYVVFKCDETKLLPEYLNFLRQNIIWKNFMQTAGNGSVRIRIYFKELGKLIFPCPEVEEQKKILEILQNANKELKIQEQHLAFLQNQKKGLMQKLLTGEIRVNVNTK